MGRTIRRLLLLLPSSGLVLLGGCSVQPDWDSNPLHQWLEQQFSRGLNHPVKLGPFEGIGFQGLEFGPTRVLPSELDGSQMSAQRLTLMPDFLASLRQGRAVAAIGLGGLQMDLRRDANGNLWTFPDTRGQAPPPLRLKLRLLDAAQLQINRRRPWRFSDGRMDLNLPAERFRFKGAFRPKGAGPRQTQLAMRLENRWGKRPAIDLRLQLRRLALPALASLTPSWPIDLQTGEASGALRFRSQGESWRCQGPLQLKQLRVADVSSPSLRFRCDGSRLQLQQSPWRVADQRGTASAQWLWRKAPWELLRLERAVVRSGPSQLVASGQLLPELKLKLNSLRIDPSQLGLKGKPLTAQGQIDGRRWSLQLQAPELDTELGPFGIKGQASGRWAEGDPLLELNSQLELQRLQDNALPVAINPLQVELKREQNALAFQGTALIDEETPLELQGRWADGQIQAQLGVKDFGLSLLDPGFGGLLSGRLDLKGTLTEPELSARFSLLQPTLWGLQAPEVWQGRWEPGSLRLSSASTEVLARLDGSRLQSLQANKGGGSLRLLPSGPGYSWTAQQWALAPLHLGLRGNRPLPLNGTLDGSGRLGLEPLRLQGNATVSKPALAWIKGRQLEIQGVMRYPGFDLRAELLPERTGSVELSARGAWNGALNLEAKGRKLQPGAVLRLLRDLRRPAPLIPEGRASDLGELAIDTLGASLDAQFQALQKAQERLALERPAKVNDGRLPLGDVQGLMDADLSVRGATTESLWLNLAARGHLWLRGEDRDMALQLEPFVAQINGPLGSGDGSFSFAGLPLGFVALLTPVPAGLRGALRGAGGWRIGQGLPTLTMDLALEQARLKDQPLVLERGRLALDGRVLKLDLSLRGGRAKNTVDVKGRLPLDPVEDGVELRVSSRGDGLVFLTALGDGEVQWQDGSIDLQLLVRGTLQTPIANGFLRLRDGALVLAGQQVEQLQATAFFDFQQLQLEQFSARSGSGQLTGEGGLAFSREGEETGLRFTAKALPIRRPDADVQLDGQLLVQGSLTRPALGGELQLSNGSINVSAGELSSAGGKSMSLETQTPEMSWDFQQPVVILGPKVESADAAALRRRVPSFGPLSFRNLRVALGPDLRITAPPVAEFMTGGLLTFNGPAGPDVEIAGVVKLLKGRITLLTNILKLDVSNVNVAVFTPSLGLIPFLDVAFTTRVSDRVGGVDSDQVVSSQELQGTFSNLDRLNLIKVIIAFSGPANRLSLDSLDLRSQPPLPQERLIALLGGNSLAGLATGNAGTALATLLGGTLLSPVISGLSNLFDERITASLYPAFLEPYVQDSRKDRNKGRVPSQLVLGAEVGVDLTNRLNLSVLSAPNRSDIPPEAILRYQATDKLGVQGALDQQGRWQGQLQLFFRF